MSRRIILFGPLPPPHGGVAIYMKALMAQLRGANIRVWTYAGGEPNDAGVRFVAHRRLGTIWALIAEGPNARVLDASHFHLEYPNPLLLAVWLLLKPLLGFEWYKNIHDGSLPKRYAAFGKGQRWLFRRAVNSVDQFVVVSEDLKRWLVEDIQVRQPVVVVPGLLPGVPSEQANTLSNESEASLQPFFAHEKRVCSIGVFYPSYGFMHVAQAVEELRRQTGKDIGLLLLDGSFIVDEAYRTDVLRNREWITVLQNVPHREVHQVLKRSDVFVRAVAQEGYGISRVEALWCGTPVVATRVGETRGMLLYDVGNVEQLISQLRSALFQPDPEATNPWPERYRKEAEENLQALTKLLGAERANDEV